VSWSPTLTRTVNRDTRREVTGLLALALLTSARSAARADEDGALVLLADQDRSRWDQRRLAEGRSLVEAALAQHRPGPYQLQAAIAACHADAATAADTDWRQIAALYSELLGFDPSPVIEANRAIAVAYAEGPAAGLAILDTLGAGGGRSELDRLDYFSSPKLRRRVSPLGEPPRAAEIRSHDQFSARASRTATRRVF
jgi:RNA polymerase sigma-70 factor (ECF subfamily)